LSSLLTASGVPNDNGRLRWPLGLRILAAPETDDLREQIDVLFQEAARQAASGPVNSGLIQEMSDAVKKFRKLLLKDKAERFRMPLAVYSESERFLDQLEHANQVLKAGLEKPAEEARLKSNGSSTAYPSPPPAKMQKQSMAAVGLYDNYFQPSTITVPIGTTIQWTNYGQQRHTVTWDDGRWSPKELN
jgi:plastocyanin